ncbi:phospholipase D family protein [Ramlibacter sp. AN1015]|uniref:phospholipase D-like domain-containing protein n=1 Tax=Ramlibacter sp. AN1015 TaxID=3133428 RepID=UPI0030BD8672
MATAPLPLHDILLRRVLRLMLAILMLNGAAACASLPQGVERPVSKAFAAPATTPLGKLSSTLRARAQAHSDSGFHLLDTVESALTSRLALVEGARHTLDLQYYAMHADASTELILSKVRDAARRGVRVRILLDDFNSAGEDAQILRIAFEPNVEFRLFNPLPGSRGSFVGRILGSLHDVQRIQQRMHNKLFIADSAWGITGGRNLGDAYFGDDESSNFVDLDVLATGRIVRDMAASFDRYWNDELAYPVQSLLSPEDLDRLRRRAPQAPKAPADAAVLPVVAPGAGTRDHAPMDLARVRMVWAPSILLVDKPEKIAAAENDPAAGDTVVDGLIGLMRQARKDVLIVSPYFVPGAQMMAAFADLRERGVAVRVLTNSLASNDAPAAHAGYARYRRDLLRLGVQLHEMRADPHGAVGLAGSAADRSGHGAFGLGGSLGSGIGGSKGATSKVSLHSKAVVIDRSLSVIGSMNLDLRSQLQNSEVALLIRSGTLGGEAARLIESTLARSAYRVAFDDDGLVWRAPPGASFGDARSEPEASLRLRLLVRLLGPFAPDEML